MNKENACAGELSDEQRTRISRNFRAAKALLDRKRPRDATPNSIHRVFPKNEVVKGNEIPGSVFGIRRVPLSDISVNSPSPLPVRSFKLMKNEGTGVSSCEGLSGYKSDINLKMRATVENSSEVLIRQVEDSGNVCSKSMPVRVNKVGLFIPAENGRGDDSVVTPVKLLECNGNLFNDELFVCRPETNGSGVIEKNPGVVSIDDGFGLSSYITPVRQQNCSRLSASSVSPGISDEEFDESFFGEIDALCEKAVHRSDERSSTGIQLKSDERSADIQLQSECTVKCIVDKNGVDPMVLEKTLITPDVLGSIGSQEFPEEGLRSLSSCNSSQLEGMPEEYAKYLRSLNERQREAACSDISVPLMIVAGPGCGKTSTMVGPVLMLLNEGIAPSHILAMTFTTAATSEMRDRIGKVAGKATSKELMISTFHSFSLQLCRTHAEKLDRTPEFLLYGQDQQRRVIIEAVRLTILYLQNLGCTGIPTSRLHASHLIEQYKSL